MSHIGLIAPSGIFKAELIAEGVELLESWGHTVTRAPHLEARHLCFAGTITERVMDLEWALDTPEVELIWCARGGYGAALLLSELNARGRVINKPTLGFSDITALGVYCVNRHISQIYHAPVLHSLSRGTDEAARAHVREFLARGRLPDIPIEPLTASPLESSVITAPLIGGNLCVITTLIGTPDQLNTRGAILLLEDVAEPAYKVHRMLSQLRLSGGLEDVRAVVFGTFTRCEAPDDYALNEIILDALAGCDIPLYMTTRVGHGLANDLWRMGATYRLTHDALSPEMSSPVPFTSLKV